MLVTVIVSDQIHHQHLATNTACLQHQLPTSMWPFILDGWKMKLLIGYLKLVFKTGQLKFKTVSTLNQLQVEFFILIGFQ